MDNAPAAVVWFWVGHYVDNRLSLEGPFENEEMAIEHDKSEMDRVGPEHYVRRHTCPVLKEDSDSWKRKILLNFRRQKRLRREKEKEKGGNNSSQFRDIYGF